MNTLEKAFEYAKETFARKGVDVMEALRKLETIPLSLHAWQGDDVTGFDNPTHALTGGCQVTGNYPGRARTAQELRQDLDQVMALLPGPHRVNLQAHEVDCVLPGQDRDALEERNFAQWLQWAKERKLGLDLAPAYYSHPKLDHGLSLSHPDPEIRNFWIRHGQACRRIGANFGKVLGTPCVCNVWVPDGFKDTPADRTAPRMRLLDSLDKTFQEPLPESQVLDAVESKLFGIGAESCTVGSHDFYLTYAARNRKLICLDSGHFHPTESVADKLSSLCCQQGRILLHVSRGVRWDSDHVLALNDELLAIAHECVHCCTPQDIHIALDYFDASINRIAAWVIGARNLRKALLIALLEPALAVQEEQKWDFTGRLAPQEAAKTLPWGIVWDAYCQQKGIPSDDAFMAEIRNYEKQVLSLRG